MKRYGYKFEKMDGGYTSAIDARAFSLFFAIVFSIFFGIIFGYRASYFGVGFLYFVVGFISEFFPKVGLCVAFIIFIGIASLFLHAEYFLFEQCFENCTPWSARKDNPDKISIIWQSVFLGTFFFAYNLVVIWLFYLRAKSKS